MDIVERYIKKYASATYKTCADDPLTHQFKDVFVQCDQQNNKSKHKFLSKKSEKEKLSNVLSMLLRMKEIAEKKEFEWYTERVQLREQLDKLEQSITVASASVMENECQCDVLSEELDRLTELNSELEERLEECEERCILREQRVSSMEEKEMQREHVVASLKAELLESKSQLLHKEQCILSLKAQGIQDKCNHYSSSLAHVCPLEVNGTDNQTIDLDEQTSSNPDSPLLTLNQIPPILTPQTIGSRQRIEFRHKTPQSLTNLNSVTNPVSLTIQDRTNLCQILGKFDTNASPISLSNKLEAVITQYNLGNKDACALLRAWLPYQLAAQLKAPVGTHRGITADSNTNWGNVAERIKELQRIMCGRDARGANALENSRLKRGDDPVLFCNDYLSLYRATYSCPNMSHDDTDFLYSMANKCTAVDYSIKVALRNANSYQTFINILKDWIQDTKDDKTHRKISEIVKNEGRPKFNGKCYKCGNTGHIMRDCRLQKRYSDNKKNSYRPEHKKPEHNNQKQARREFPDSNPYGPLIKELEKMKTKIATQPEEYEIPLPTNPYRKQ
ncbi:posterior protein-like [Bombina bombina]|uniref:posterior protein-like n=2 Tax=Bombina bombina TaxID=8345 RepID=UPI00235A5FC3|nr:posterior protein-like [Bombina bombina]